jgi:hypothetical protein
LKICVDWQLRPYGRDPIQTKEFSTVFLRTSLAALLLISASAAYAAPATPEGAAHLQDVFQTYCGTPEGLISVEPAGESYDVSIDVTPLAAFAPEGAASFSATPYRITLTDQGDGIWATAQDQAFDLTLSVPGAIELSMTAASLTGSGVFDEKLMAFVSATYDFTDLRIDETIGQLGKDQMKVAYRITSGHYESQARAGADGGVDGEISMAMNDLSEVFTIPRPLDGSGAGMKITADIDSYTIEQSNTGIRTKGLYGLLAWFVAHPSPEAITADQEELRALLQGGVPVFNATELTGKLDGLRVSTQWGEFYSKSAHVVLAANGVVKDGMFREGITLSGLSIPKGIAPDWASELLPENLSFDFAVSRFDVATPVGMLIKAFDLTQDSPIDEAMSEALLMAFLPEGEVDITIAPGQISNDLYALNYEGAMSVGPMGTPAGSATISAKGLDLVMEKLAGAPDDIKGQAIPIMALAKGMAKAGDDGALVWDIDARQPGKVLVNGVDVMAMAGGQ